METRINFLGVPLDTLTLEETIVRVNNAILSNQQIHHCVINAGKVAKMQKDNLLRESVINSDLINADGMSIVWAARFLGFKIPERVTGIDLMESLVSLSYKNDYKCFFLGASSNVLNNLICKYSNKYSEKIIAGYRDGYYTAKEESDIVNQINNSNANILFVAMTSPKKEIFLNKFRKELGNINFIMGVGGSFDVISGKTKRAPVFIQKIGFEWFFRFLQEPKRMWKRYLVGNISFVFLVIRQYFKQIY